MKLLSLFSGIGAFEKALLNLSIPHKVVGFSEIDKFAIKSYCAIHNTDESLNLGDIRTINTDTLPDCDMITYGFPCQDISVAGRQQGIVEDETRSGLLYDALRMLRNKRPKYAIAENVKNLAGKKFKSEFQEMLGELDSYGYNNYWKVLNAKNYGIPQNRERVFIISIRKDVDDGTFEWPEPFDNGLRLEDMLETEVDEKYYLSKNIQERFKPINGGGLGSYTGLYKVGCIDNDCQANRVYSPDGIACTQISGGGGLGAKTGLYDEGDRIRRLTPIECFRLMGFTDSDFYKCKDIGISDMQLYKQAGNSVVVNVLMEIFEKLFAI